jgi:hypothetical protein
VTGVKLAVPAGNPAAAPRDRAAVGRAAPPSVPDIPYLRDDGPPGVNRTPAQGRPIHVPPAPDDTPDALVHATSSDQGSVSPATTNVSAMGAVDGRAREKPSVLRPADTGAVVQAGPAGTIAAQTPVLPGAPDSPPLRPGADRPEATPRPDNQLPAARDDGPPRTSFPVAGGDGEATIASQKEPEGRPEVGSGTGEARALSLGQEIAAALKPDRAAEGMPVRDSPADSHGPAAPTGPRTSATPAEIRSHVESLMRGATPETFDLAIDSAELGRVRFAISVADGNVHLACTAERAEPAAPSRLDMPDLAAPGTTTSAGSGRALDLRL